MAAMASMAAMAPIQKTKYFKTWGAELSEYLVFGTRRLENGCYGSYGRYGRYGRYSCYGRYGKAITGLIECDQSRYSKAITRLIECD